MKKILSFVLLCATILLTSCKEDEQIIASSVTLNSTTLSLVEGTTGTLTATITPDDVDTKDLTWMSCNEAVAIVDDKGTVTAVAVGKATITVVTRSGGKSASCEVTVTAAPIPVTSMALDVEALTLNLDEEHTFTVTVTPADATNVNVKWTTSDNKVATVSDAGKVTAVGVGTATVTATEDGGKTASCEVTVNKKDGPTVVMSGYKVGRGDYEPQWWDNGVVKDLAGAPNVNPRLLAVNGGDVYMAGTANYIGHVWKNGVITSITTAGDIRDIAFIGKDLYSLFEGEAQNGNGTIMIQKNEEAAIAWTDGTEKGVRPRVMKAVGSDIYVAATKTTLLENMKQETTFLVYKNKTLLYEIKNIDGDINMYVADNGDVYLSAAQNKKSLIWKNGTLLYTLPDGGFSYTSTVEMCLSGNDLYVVKYCSNMDPFPYCLWKNGEIVNDQLRSIGSGLMGLTIENDKAYIFMGNYNEDRTKYTLLRWCSDGTTKEILKDSTFDPSAICAR